jgi:hypothetical protein
MEISLYPVIESFVERATPQDVEQFFASLKEGLQGLKGPRAEQAKKVQVAIERTEELLAHLLEVREKIEEDRRAGAKSR